MKREKEVRSDNMTKEKVIDILKNIKDGTACLMPNMPEDGEKAIDIAIKTIEQSSSVQPEIIYCGNGCKFWNSHIGEQVGICDILRQCTHESFYCGNAKKREAKE